MTRCSKHSAKQLKQSKGPKLSPVGKIQNFITIKQDKAAQK